ncbi:hypothetical protein A7U60_g1194 [Sanghuangporus baumii]|uniref:Uncharacterized protein n=1 Tax=Sanghuangporus baumii TaxID=108892 RepID=A0A9Q5I4F6_SANBA|nr:hypothetical protein A7U60_g1194 [Sanghuangporus baumii]
MQTSMVLLELLEALREHTPTMPVCAGPPYPSLSYRTADRPAVYGFVSHHVNDVRQQVYTELRAERARAPDTQRSYHIPYAYSSRYSRPHHAPHADMHNRRDNTSTTRSRLAFPQPQVPSFSAGPSPAYPGRQVRFQSPHSYDPYTPASSYQTATSALTARPMRMPEPQPYPLDPLPINTPTQRTYQSQAQVVIGFRIGKLHRMYLRKFIWLIISILFIQKLVKNEPNYVPTPSKSPYAFCLWKLCFKGKDMTIALRKALEKMQDFKRVADEWMLIIRRNRGENLTAEETAVISLISDLRQRAKTALNTIDVILASISAYEGIGNGSPFSSEKLKADTSALAMIGTSLHHKLAGLTRRLKNAEAMAGQTEPPSSPDCCTRLMNFPGCIANLYLKKRLFRFTSLLKAQREQYSELDSEKPVQSGLYAPPISTLIGAVYAEIQRTYNTAAKALAGFESSLRAFQLDLQSQANNRYLPVATG